MAAPPVTVDRTAPTASGISIDAGASSTATALVTLGGIAGTDDLSGIASMRFSNDGTTWSAWEPFASSRPTAWDLTDASYGGATGDGTKTVFVQLRDALGNGPSNTVSDTIVLATVDLDPPAVDWQSPDEGTTAMQAATSVTLTWSAADALSGIASTMLTQESGAVVTPGTCADVTWSPNTTAPATSPATVDGLASGTCYRWTMVATDRAGNGAAAVSGSVLVDTTVPAAPSVVSFGPGSYQASADGSVIFRPAAGGSVELAATPPGGPSGPSGMLGIRFQGLYSGYWTASPALPAVDSTAPYEETIAWTTGAHAVTIEVVTVSGAGVASLPTVIELLPDSASPSVAFDTVPAFLATPSLSVSWSEADASSGIAGRSVFRQTGSGGEGGCGAVDWADDGSSSSSGSPIAAAGLANGSCYRWVLTVWDRVGNTTTRESGAVLVDLTPPSVDFATPDEALSSAVSGADISVSWTESDTGSGIASRTLQRQSEDETGGLCPTSAWNAEGPNTTEPSPQRSSPLTVGRCYRWVVTVTDRAGNSASWVSGSVAVSPVVVIAPIPSSTTFAHDTLTASVSPGITASRVEYRVDGALIGSATSSPYTLDWDTSTVADGAHTISARAVDTDGGNHDSPAVALTVSNGLGSNARVEADNSAGRLSVDDYVRYGVYSLASIYSLPARYQTSRVTASDPAMTKYLRLWDSVSSPTRTELTAFFSQPFRGGLYQAPPGQTLGSTSPDFPNCGDMVSDISKCHYSSTHFDFYYYLKPVAGGPGMPRLDNNHNQIPDPVDTIEAVLGSIDRRSAALGFAPAGDWSDQRRQSEHVCSC